MTHPHNWGKGLKLPQMRNTDETQYYQVGARQEHTKFRDNSGSQIIGLLRSDSLSHEAGTWTWGISIECISRVAQRGTQGRDIESTRGVAGLTSPRRGDRRTTQCALLFLNQDWGSMSPNRLLVRSLTRNTWWNSTYTWLTGQLALASMLKKFLFLILFFLEQIKIAMTRSERRNRLFNVNRESRTCCNYCGTRDVATQYASREGRAQHICKRPRLCCARRGKNDRAIVELRYGRRQEKSWYR